MPTGYTAPVQDGMSFNDFVLNCSRGMGALITLRDRPNDEIPDVIEPSISYHEKSLAEAKSRLKELESWDDETICEKHSEYIQKERDDFLRRKKKNLQIQNRYYAMLEKVQKWQPPTPDHEGLKKFMIDQLKQSIDFDCHDVTSDPILDSEHWLLTEKESAIYDIKYHEKEIQKEIERADSRTKWIQELKKSLGI